MPGDWPCSGYLQRADKGHAPGWHGAPGQLGYRRSELPTYEVQPLFRHEKTMASSLQRSPHILGF